MICRQNAQIPANGVYWVISLFRSTSKCYNIYSGKHCLGIRWKTRSIHRSNVHIGEKRVFRSAFIIIIISEKQTAWIHFTMTTTASPAASLVSERDDPNSKSERERRSCPPRWQKRKKLLYATSSTLWRHLHRSMLPKLPYTREWLAEAKLSIHVTSPTHPSYPSLPCIILTKWAPVRLHRSSSSTDAFHWRTH